MPVRMIIERVVSHMKTIEGHFRKVLDTVKEKKVRLSDPEKAFIEEFFSFLLDWNELHSGLSTLFLKASDEYVIWLEGDTRSLPNSLTIQGQPVTVADQLRDEVFVKKRASSSHLRR
ncbi:hypothetical protein ACPJHQ_15315 [Rossellomorea sp. H39__3]